MREAYVNIPKVIDLVGLSRNSTANIRPPWPMVWREPSSGITQAESRRSESFLDSILTTEGEKAAGNSLRILHDEERLPM